LCAVGKTDMVDQFRNAFFDKLIEEETKKEKEQKLLQSSCYHRYTIIEETYESRGITYEYRTCSKCGRSAIKRKEVWEGSKRCIVS